MEIKTSLNKDYVVRMVAVGLLFCAGCLWLLYDGFIGYNQVNARVAPVGQALIESGKSARELITKNENGLMPLTEAFEKAGMKPPKGLYEKLKTLSQDAEGSPTLRADTVKVLAEKVYSPHDIQGQFVTAALTFLFALVLFFFLYRRSLTRFRLEDHSFSILRKAPFSAAAAKTFSLGDLKTVDWAQWDDKRIAVLHFSDGTVQKLDAWFYAGVKPIMAAVASARPDLAEKVL